MPPVVRVEAHVAPLEAELVVVVGLLVVVDKDWFSAVLLLGDWTASVNASRRANRLSSGEVSGINNLSSIYTERKETQHCAVEHCWIIFLQSNKTYYSCVVSNKNLKN